MAERYDIKGRIGQGGVGAVYDAYDTVLNRRVAIKRLLPDDESEVAEGGIGTDLAKEAAILSSLHHPNIITLYDIAQDEEGAFVVMELIDGETIEDVVQRGAMTQEDFQIVVEQCLEALVAAQDKNLLHRDLKPTNIMVQWLGEGKFQIKILDFGLAKHSAAPAVQTVDHGGAILGSIYFLAPEQFERAPLDARTDLYALACVFYYCLTKRYPYEGETAPDVMMAHLEHKVKPLENSRPDLPKSLCDWVMRLMNRKVENRPADAKEALAEYRQIMANPEIDYYSRSLAEQPALAPQEPEPAPARSGGATSRLIMGDAAPGREQVRRSLTSRAVPIPGAGPQHPGSGTISGPIQSNPSVLVATQEVKKKPAGLWIGLGGVVLVAAIIGIYFLVSGNSNLNGSNGDNVGGLTPDGLPANGLVAYYSGWEGVITDGEKEAKSGDSVWEWRDQEPSFGDNNLVIRKTSADDSPSLVDTNPETHKELKGPTPALRFSPKNSLRVDLSDDLKSESAWKNGLTLTIALRSTDPKNATPIRFFSGDQSTGSAELVYKNDGKYFGGVRLGEKNLGFSTVEGNKSELAIITLVWRRGENFQRLFSRRPEGKTSQPTPVRREGGPNFFDQWIIGSSGPDGKKTTYSGDIYEIAIYNRGLDDEEIVVIEKAMADRYFAKP